MLSTGKETFHSYLDLGPLETRPWGLDEVLAPYLFGRYKPRQMRLMEK